MSITDITAVDTDGNDIAKGGAINISFTPLGPALTACTGAGQAGCQIGTNPPVGTCFTRILPKDAATPASVDVGPITITTENAPAIGENDGSAFERANPSAPFPTCLIRSGQYVCFRIEGIGGTVTPTGNGLGIFTGYTIGDAGTDNDDTDKARSIVALVNTTLFSLPITNVAAGSFTVFTGTLGAAVPLGVWRVVHGGGPTPLADGALNPIGPFQFLQDSDVVRIVFPGSAGATGPFSSTNKVVAVGDPFTLNAATKTFLASLDDRSDITARTGDFTLGCAAGQCGGTAAAGGGSATGTLLVLESTTNSTGGNLRIITQCSGIGSTTVNVLGTHWEFTRSRAADLDSVRATIFRPIFDPKTETGTRPPNTTNYLVGHGFVRSATTFVP